MSICDILMSNFITLALLLGMGVLILMNRSLEKRVTQMFLWFVVIVLLLDISDMADYYLSGLSSPCSWRYVTSSIGYVLRPASLMVVILVFLRRRSFHFALAIPLVVVIVLAATSGLTHLMFWFDGQNEFCRGPLGYLPHILSGLYMLLLVVESIRSFKVADVGELLVVFYIAVICVFATVLESALHYRFLLPGAMTTSCVMYFMYIYVQTYKRDAMTGTLNRRSFYTDSVRIKNQHQCVVSIDLNDLKGINDRYGHAAGDVALCTLASALISAAGKNFHIYRTGGDEFMALGQEKTAEIAESFISLSRAELGRAGYMASFGYAFYSPGDDFDEVCNRSDAEMYKDKSNYKHR